MTGTVRDAFKEKVCDGCVAKENCDMDISKQADCATLIMWRHTMQYF